MTARFYQTGVAVGLIMTAVSCGGGGSTPAPTPVTVKSAVVTLTMTIESAKVGTSNHYTAHVTVRESGGLGVTLGNATLTFFVGSAAYATIDVTGGEAWVNITLPASSSLESNPITAIDDDPTQVPDTVQIVLSYVDFNQKAGTATATAAVPTPK
jgi:hypothetical protein